jgi:hypothetical protein
VKIISLNAKNGFKKPPIILYIPLACIILNGSYADLKVLFRICAVLEILYRNCAGLMQIISTKDS